VGSPALDLLCCLTGAALESLPKCCTLSSEGPGRQGGFARHRHPSRWNFSYHCLMLFLTGGSFPNLVRKLRCTATIDCVRAYSSAQKAFTTPVVAIFSQPAPVAVPNETKPPRHVQINLESFPFYMLVAC
jgi:hypothetical protein